MTNGRTNGQGVSRSRIGYIIFILDNYGFDADVDNYDTTWLWLRFMVEFVYRVCEEMLPISQTVDFPEGSYEERLIANRRWFMTG